MKRILCSLLVLSLLCAGVALADTNITTDEAVMGHVDEIRSACLNLVTNAVRYTPDGGKIEINWFENPDDGSAVFSVKDNGIGIAPENLDKIWLRFWQADPAHSGGGAGLGLAMVRWIAEAHGGSVTAESTPGAGSTFTFTIPCEKSEKV